MRKSGSMNNLLKVTSEGLFAKLEELGIEFENYEHPPLRTVAESQALRGELPGAHIKNLFLRDKKKALLLDDSCGKTAKST